MDAKLSKFFITFSQIVTFLLGGSGAYAFARFLSSRLHFPSILTDIIGLVLFCAVCMFVLHYPDTLIQKNTDDKARAQYFLKPIIRAYRDGTPDEKFMLEQIVRKYSDPQR